MAKLKLTRILALLYTGLVVVTIVCFTILVNVMDGMNSSAQSLDLEVNYNHIKSK